MGPTPQWCETAIRSANGGFFTQSQASSLKRGARTKDGSRRVPTAWRNGAPRSQERLDVSLASAVGSTFPRSQSQKPGDAGMAGGGS